MKKNRRILIAAALLFLAVGNDRCVLAENGEGTVWLDLFCDVNFWHPPLWDLSEDTITGQITERTGAAVTAIVPTQNADKDLSIRILNDELPDLISVVDPIVCGQLASSGKVWNLEEFCLNHKSCGI